MGVPFVGRDLELKALCGLVPAARRASGPTAALVSGEPGSGKSRLLREVLRDADPDRTVLVAGFEPIESIPLAAMGHVIRRLATVPGHGARLEALVFGSSDPRGQTGLPVFEAAHRAARELGPLVIAVDDLQWLDAQSLALLQYLVRAAETTRQPLAVIAASRPDGAAARFEDVLANVL
ncbi:MAG TPA: ATP-binding protein, partial [Candidatus Limnocylindrales bacterium]|nr:ATP-binding protein [Candidatus Limnocylindrales bacterium]